MALLRVPDMVNKLWNEWNLRGAVLFSLFLQVVLIFLAPSRKRTKNKMITSVIWLAYLLADWVAVFAIGNISSDVGGGQGGNCDKLRVNKELASLWAPFLLLHLGGPDTITAFSLEDNELWLRHLLGFVLQLAAVVYVISQSVPNEFWIPTLLLFLAGAIKYGERTRALFLACLTNFKCGDRFDSDSLNQEGHNSDLKVVKYGYTYFKTFRGLIIEGKLADSRDNIYRIRQYFINRTYEDAFREVEVELNFMYDVLYTKMEVVHNKMGYVFRLLCSLLIMISFQQFVASHHTNKDKLIHGARIDIVVTYTLFIGAVGLDFVSVLMLIFSDWTLVSELLDKNTKTQQARSIIFAKRKKLFPMLLIDKRWCQSVPQLNFRSYSWAKLNSSSSWFDFFGLKDFLDKMQHVKTELVKDNLKEFIFEELKKKATSCAERDYSKTWREIFSAKGNWTLKEYQTILGDHLNSSIVGTVSEEVEYHEILLVWHVATGLCYFKDKENVDDPNYREYCKILSDYMFYLLAMQPTLVANAPQLRIPESFGLDRDEMREKLMEDVDKLLSGISESETMATGIERHIVTWRGGVLLAKKLLRLDDKKKMWEIMGSVWVELLCYGASHSKRSAHAQQLSNGGELINIVWLLINHFFLGRPS